MSDFLHDHLRGHALQQHRAPWTMPDQALRFRNPRDIPGVLEASGNHWLSPESQAIHGHELDTGTLLGDRFFVVEHRSPDPARVPDEYTVNWASRAPGGDHVSIQRFDDRLPTREAAVALATKAWQEIEPATYPSLDMPVRTASQAVATYPGPTPLHPVHTHGAR